MTAQKPVPRIGQTVEEARTTNRVEPGQKRDLGAQRVGLQLELAAVAACRDLGPQVLRRADFFR